ncbi:MULTISPECIES: DUF2066 domain-containing protein [Nitrincola]|uniref:Uncharacterized protein n=1 Tax=Nitrincola nitratireducens TaxID=1229521 RepID=W9V5X4_9GAMM|nr:MULTISPECIES: DUF2066 domain-containing protein [Nitrincola]EXJ11512.1 hypothetical protein D791_01644 [Nitrincola nitratireducens]
MRSFLNAILVVVLGLQAQVGFAEVVVPKKTLVLLVESNDQQSLFVRPAHPVAHALVEHSSDAYTFLLPLMDLVDQQALREQDVIESRIQALLDGVARYEPDQLLIGHWRDPGVNLNAQWLLYTPEGQARLETEGEIEQQIDALVAWLQTQLFDQDEGLIDPSLDLSMRPAPIDTESLSPDRVELPQPEDGSLQMSVYGVHDAASYLALTSLLSELVDRSAIQPVLFSQGVVVLRLQVENRDEISEQLNKFERLVPRGQSLLEFDWN